MLHKPTIISWLVPHDIDWFSLYTKLNLSTLLLPYWYGTIHSVWSLGQYDKSCFLLFFSLSFSLPCSSSPCSPAKKGTRPFLHILVNINQYQLVSIHILLGTSWFQPIPTKTTCLKGIGSQVCHSPKIQLVSILIHDASYNSVLTRTWTLIKTQTKLQYR